MIYESPCIYIMHFTGDGKSFHLSADSFKEDLVIVMCTDPYPKLS